MELVTGAMGRLLPKLCELLKDEYDLQTGVRKTIEALSRELESVHAALRKVAKVPPEQLDELVKLWARDLREVSYDMEDIIDAFLVRDVDCPESAEPRMLGRLQKKMGKLFSKDRRKIACAIQDINKKLQEVAARRGRYTVDDIPMPAAPATTVDPRLQTLYKRASELVGIEGQMDKLIKMLSLEDDGSDTSDKKVKMVYVVGIGGLGKTTLAKAVYDKLKPQFHHGAFVPVGQNPDVKKVFGDILGDLDKQRYMNSNMRLLDERQLINELQEFLSQEIRCLIVMDDIWDKKSWDLIRCSLQNGNSGNRVVTTTRSLDVATHADDVYKMQPLSRKDSEKLLYTRIVEGEGKNLDSPMAEACDNILKKCGGVPLALVNIASVLANKPREDWSEVHTFISSGHGDGGNDYVENTRRILSLSYHDLPLHLKPCLLYLSIFPTGYYIEKNFLIWKWIAEGFVHEGKAVATGLFELGERYFNDLVNRNMIQPVEAEDTGYVEGCCVHDMVLDLIRSLSTEENFVTVLEGTKQLEPQRINARRLAMHDMSFEENNGHQLGNIDPEQLRSVILNMCSGSAMLSKRFRVARVVSIESHFWNNYSENCLQHVGSLLHLRYLGLQNVGTSELPKEIGDLKFLQVLDLLKSDIRNLPESMGLLTNLLCLRGSNFTRGSAGLIGKLTSLQELWIRPSDDTRQFVKAIGRLRELRVLRTCIFTTHKTDELLSRDLVDSLSNLHKLKIMDIRGESRMKKGLVWEAGFASPQPLVHLRLRCLVFCTRPVWVNSSLLPNLCYLDLQVQVLKGQDMEILGRLPELRHLELCSRDTAIICTEETAGNGSFEKLKFFKAIASFVLFDLRAVMCSKKAATMPSLESLEFFVDVQFLKHASRLGFDSLLNFGNLGRVSLRRVEATIACPGAPAVDVEEAEAALARVAAFHPNCPTLKMTRIDDYHLPTSVNPKVVAQNVNVREMKDGDDYFDFHWLLRNPCLEKFSVSIICEDATLEEVEEAEMAVRWAIDDHPNCPTLEMVRCAEDKMMSTQLQQPKVVHRYVNVRKTNDGDNVFGLFWLLKNPYVEKLNVSIDCENASLEEVEEAEAAVRFTVDVHPNRPTLEMTRYAEDKMMVLSSYQHQQA